MTNLPITPEPEPITPEPETFRVARGIDSRELSRLVSAMPLTNTEAAVSKVITDYYFKKDGWSNCPRADVIRDAHICKATLDRVLGDIAVNRKPKRGKPADAEPRPNIWVIAAGRGGNLESKKHAGTYIASRYFPTEEFVLDAIARLNARRADEVATAIANGKKVPKAVHPTVKRIYLDGVEFFTIDALGNEIKNTPVEAPVEAPKAIEAAPVAKAVAKAPTQSPVAPQTAPLVKAPVVAPAVVSTAPKAPVEAPVAPPVARAWKVSPKIVNAFVAAGGTYERALAAIDNSGNLPAIELALKNAVSASVGRGNVSEALTARILATGISGTLPKLSEIGGWVLDQLKEIDAQYLREWALIREANSRKAFAA